MEIHSVGIQIHEMKGLQLRLDIARERSAPFPDTNNPGDVDSIYDHSAARRMASQKGRSTYPAIVGVGSIRVTLDDGQAPSFLNRYVCHHVDGNRLAVCCGFSVVEIRCKSGPSRFCP
jgi:hypothetical protein